MHPGHFHNYTTGYHKEGPGKELYSLFQTFWVLSLAILCIHVENALNNFTGVVINDKKLAKHICHHSYDSFFK